MKPRLQQPLPPPPDRGLSAQLAATKALAEASSLDEAMPQILRAICENLDWDAGAFWTLARGGNELECRATFRPHGLGAELEAITRDTRFARGQGLPGRVWASDAWILLDFEEKTESPRVPAALRAGFRRAFGYPLHGPAGWFGVLEFCSREIREPDESLLEMLESIASQVTQYLDRRRAEESTRFLSEASALLATSLDYELTFARLVTLSVPFLGDWCAVDVVQDDRPYRRIAAAHVDPERARLVREVQERWPPPPDSPAGYPKVLRTGEPDFFPDVPPAALRAAAVDAEHADALESLGYRSLICVPLSVRGRVLGAMTFVIAGNERRFERRDYELAQDLARRAGVAIDNARLFGELERSRRAAALLAEASRLLATPDAVSRLEDVARLAGSEFGGIVTLVLPEEDGRFVTHGWAEPEHVHVLAAFRNLTRLPEDLRYGVPHVIKSGETEVLQAEDVDAFLARAPESSHPWRSFGVTASMTVPLVSRGRVLGALAMRSFRPGHRYCREQIALAEDLAQRLALAIENARLHRQAGDALKARDEFLSVASHELRTPLTALHLLVRTLQDGEQPAALTPEKLEIAERQIHRIAKLVNQLFDLSRLTAGRLELELEDVDLSGIARDVAARMADTAFESGCVVAVRAPAPVVGHWDRFRLEQIATNLLANALKYGRGKPVEVTVEDRGATARLTVRDHGIGIPREHLTRIFERFSRANPGRRYDGLGLGLYIIKQILDALGGQVTVESEPGKGALFVVDLPK